jgi:hypothetical protein
VLQDWYEDGLGRVIQSYDDALQPMWEGFVNQVTIRQAGLELTRGPLVNVANRLFAIYSSIDTSTTPPTPGIRKTTGVVNHLESQARYGIWPKVLSLAGVTDPNAEQLRDTHLAEYAKPETRSSFAPSGEEITLSVECLGFVHALSYPYNQTSNSGTTTLSTKLQAILAADPNGWISSDMSHIATNTLAVGQWENDNHLALGLVKGLTALGDANDNRHLFGIYEERQAVYGPAPTDWEYEMRLSDPRQAIFNRTGGEVPAWAVRAMQPLRWIGWCMILHVASAPPTCDLEKWGNIQKGYCVLVLIHTARGKLVVQDSAEGAIHRKLTPPVAAARCQMCLSTSSITARCNRLLCLHPPKWTIETKHLFVEALDRGAILVVMATDEVNRFLPGECHDFNSLEQRQKSFI